MPREGSLDAPENLWDDTWMIGETDEQ